MVAVRPLGRAGLAWAQSAVTRHHYRHAPVDVRAQPQAWAVELADLGRVGCLIVSRPEATRCYPWYGSLGDVASGRAERSYWEILNLARVWLDPAVQAGGVWCTPKHVPGYVDRTGVWRSTLASEALRALAQAVGVAYLLARPPVWLHEPYEIGWLLSYCEPRHRGTIYQAAGFTLHRTNAAGLQTWRLTLPPLTQTQHQAIAAASAACPRARRFRGERERQRHQLALECIA